MRNLVFLIIAGVAGFMGYLWPRPACPAVARSSGPACASQKDCLDRWAVCESHDPGGMQWGARPSAWRLARGPGGGVARLEPQYDRGR